MLGVDSERDVHNTGPLPAKSGEDVSVGRVWSVSVYGGMDV